MIRLKFVFLLVFALGCHAEDSFSKDLDSPKKPAPPSILFILADDLGWKDLGSYGHPYHRTPALDRLAEEGCRFTQAYANAPNCAPSRACLMTGLYTPRHGVYTVGKSARGKSAHRKLIPTTNRVDLDSDFQTVAERLREKGYLTAHMGKWHLGEDPRTQGFDENIAGGQAGHPKSYRSPYKNAAIEDGVEGEHLTERLGREAVSFLRRADGEDRPFFLYLPYYSVHTPIQPPRDLESQYLELLGQDVEKRKKKAAYAAMVEGLDRSIGQVMKTLDELGRREETFVVFMSDNGGHGVQTTMDPLRGSKGMLYEGGIRVPLIVRYPAKIKSREETTPVIGLDLVPTFLEMAACDFDPLQLDGISLCRCLERGDPVVDRSLFWHFPAYLQGYRKEDRWRTTPAGAIRKGDHKLIEFFEDGKLELYDLSQDLGEANNIAEKAPELARSLHQELMAWRKTVEAPVPSDPNPDYDKTKE